MKFKTQLLAAVLTLGFAVSSQAVQIKGDIDFAGRVVYDTDSLLTATQANTLTGTVTGTSDDFDSVAIGSVVSFTTPYVLNSGNDVQLWTVGGFTFTLDNSVIETQTSKLLFVTGTGTLTGNGFDATPGLWSFTSTQSNGQTSEEFSFSSNTTAVPSVPDGGATVALLGLAFVGIAAVRSKLQLA